MSRPPGSATLRGDAIDGEQHPDDDADPGPKSMSLLGAPYLFEDRAEAGAALSRALEPEVDEDEDAVVVGLARGGVVVAAVVAQALDLPLEVVAVRKVKHPLQPEYALGAVAPGAPAFVRGHDGLTDGELAVAVGLARTAAGELDRRLRRGRPQPSFDGRAVLLVDDGLATGATMIAAARWARGRGAGRVVAAAPIGARETGALLRHEVDELVCPHLVDRLGAVGLWYADFPEVHDEEVSALLTGSAEPKSFSGR
jgi:putative phosphoribosyl transferase